MNKIIMLTLLLLLCACEAGKFSPERQKLYKDSGWDDLYNQ